MIMLDWGYFDCHLHLRLLPLPNFESDFLEILKSLVAPDWEHVLVKVIELLAVTFGDDPEHEGIVSRILL